MPATHELSVGSVLQGRYEIQSVLGAGGFGTVYQATQLATHRQVAIKVMQTFHDEDPHKRSVRMARFRREMDLCARLHHPNIVDLVDSGETDDGQPFAAFQYVPGKSLAQVIAQEGPLHPREARFLMAQVLDALSCAHNLGVVHRDLKPANIMVVSTGTRRNALVLDFGIGAVAEGARGDGYAKLTSQHEWLGTPHYTAPEQVRGYPPAPASDLYSWGLVFLECLTGKPAIEGSSMAVILMLQIGPDPVPMPPALRHHALGRLLQRALIKDVEHRVVTAATLLRELEDCDLGGLDRQAASDVPRAARVDGVGPTEDSGSREAAGAVATVALSAEATVGASAPPAIPSAASAAAAARAAAPGAMPTPTPSAERNARQVEGERRPITALCCSLHPAAGVELDDLDEIVHVQQEICADLAERFGGQIVGGLGQQVLIELGYPTAREDDARRAARAALAIRDAVAARNARPDTRHPLEVRIGIHTGIIAYGPLEANRRISGQVVGMTPMIATQINAKAARGAIVVSGATAQQLRAHFVLTPVGTQAIDGAAREVELFAVEAERPAAVASHTGDSDAPLALVGREREMDLLLQRWQQVVAGHGQSVLVTGEAGIGKSRLAYELGARVGEAARTWLEARCTSETRNRALAPIVELLERTFGLTELDPGAAGDARLERLEAALLSIGFLPADAVPLFAPLLSIPLGTKYVAPDLSPARRRELTQEAFLSMLLEQSEARPVVLFVEDLHWADPATLELLGALVAAAPSGRILAMFTARPEFVPPWPSSAMLQLQLARLDRAQVEQIVGLVTAGRALPTGILEQMVNRTDGVPLFVEELTRMVMESGALTAKGDHFELTGTLSDVAIPTTLRASLMARLDRLGRAKETAQLASAIGREFELPLLTAVSGLEQAQVQEDLERLVAADLVQHKRRLRNPTWLFRHALIRDTAYESMLKKVQHRVHARIAEVLEQQFPDVAAARPELLALHHAAADQKPQAIGYAQKAAMAALIGASYPFAIRHAREAIGWLDAAFPAPGDERARAEMELGFNAIIMPSLMSTRGWRDDELEATIQRTRELSDRLGGNPFTGVALWSLLLFAHMGGRERAQARELAERFLAHARDTNDGSAEVMALAALGHTRWIDGDYALAGEHWDRTLATYDVAVHGAHAYSYGHDSRMWAGISYCEALWFMGQPARSLQLAEDTLAWARQLNHAPSLAIAYIFFILLRHDRGERAPIEELWRPLCELSQRHGLPIHVAYAGVVRSWAVGDLDAAKQHLGLLEMTGTELGLSFYRSVVAEAEAEQGQLDAAIARIRDCRRAAEDVGEKYYLAELLRLEGRFLLARDRADAGQAETLFRRGLEVAEGQGTRLLELRCAVELARLLDGRGERDEARALLAPRLAAITDGLDTTPLAEARDLLATLT
jgi:TOMM system kinase/cyclase fusion protein